MNKHNGFVTCSGCGCVTRERKVTRVIDSRDVVTVWCRDEAKCAHQRKIKTERDRRLHAALQAREDRDADRQMGYEMKAYFTGMS